MQKKNIIISIILLSSVTLGCKKEFLDRSSLSQLAASNFWQTEKDAQYGINGVYETLQDRVLFAGSLNETVGLTQFDCLTDNSFNNYKWEGAGNLMEGNIDPANGWFYSLWASCYKGIGRANTAIEKISAMTDANISASKRASYVAQAKFLRALYYYVLAIHFEEVPVILKISNVEDAFAPKNTYAEVRDQIIKDLTEASADLPASYSSAELGYATKGAALGLLARFQLYNKNYNAVITATDPMLTMGYGLYSNYTNLFTTAGEKSNEIVFAIRFVQDPAQNNGETFSGTYVGIPKVDAQPMKNLVNDYYCTDGKPITASPLYNTTKPNVNRDPRLTASVYFKGDTFLIDQKKPFAGNTATTYGQRKYIRNNAVSTSGIASYNPGGQDFYFIRYADVLLMRAEALVEAGRQGEAYPLINQVRARVGMPTVESAEGAGLSQDQMRAIVRHERRVELAFEGLRFFDLKRWNDIAGGYQRSLDDKVAGYAPAYRSKKSEVFPIPQKEIDVNKKLVQHPAWQ